eukprot:3361131-Prymnesium_polylepis.1
MFERIQARGYPVRMLQTQYRMHPAISRFPSQEFLRGQASRRCHRGGSEERRPIPVAQCGRAFVLLGGTGSGGNA